jgi:1-acyl-sn-glycerol-3-phosphate acyltransferase
MARISEERASDRVKIVEKIAQFEREGRFDEDVEDDPPGREIQPGEVDYLGKKLRSKIQSKFAYSMARRYLNSIIEEKKLIIKDIIGIENFANLSSGAIITCNHFNAFDSFAIQVAYESSGHKKRKFYRIIREGNYTSFPGFFGYLMRHCNTLPLSSNPSAMKEFTRATDTLLKQGHFVLVYPEQSMWWNYRKPKPVKPGGFYLAAKNKLPVLPCFITMKDTKLIGEDGFPIQEYTIHVSEPIYPKEGVRTGVNAEMMANENSRVWKEIYEREYGIPLRYDESEIEENNA